MSASDERDEVARRVIFNLPNILTIFRILALPFCAWALIAEDGENSELRTLSFAITWESYQSG
jgi:phosphatidylglycerophosphate synthase